MKKYFFIILIVSIHVFFASVVFAQPDNRLPLMPLPNQKSTNVINEEIKAIQEKVDTKLSDINPELRTRVVAIKDTRRKEQAIFIIGQFDRINNVSVIHFNNVINHLDEVVSMVESRAEKLKSQGADTQAVERSVQKAKNVISQARTAISNQTIKSYQNAIDAKKITLQDNAESAGQNILVSSMRREFQLVRDQLKNDLFTLRDGVIKSARSTTDEALRELMKVNIKNPTP